MTISTIKAACLDFIERENGHLSREHAFYAGAAAVLAIVDRLANPLLPPREPFNAQVFWAPHEWKKYVVTLAKPGIRKKPKIDKATGRIEIREQTLYVSARDADGAKRAARTNTFLQGRLSCISCRLATPTDLGCTLAPTSPAFPLPSILEVLRAESKSLRHSITGVTA